MTQPLTAEDVAALVKQRGLPLTVPQVKRYLPPGHRDSPRSPLVWDRAVVERWLKQIGLAQPRTLVRIEALAQSMGVSYWTARRQVEPTVVLSHVNKWYELPA